jgi:hypothetical protein
VSAPGRIHWLNLKLLEGVKMDTIKFVIEDYVDKKYGFRFPETKIYINGKNLIDLVQQVERPVLDPLNLRSVADRSYVGLNPEWRPNIRHEFLGDTRYPYSVVLTCTCHEDWCNSILVKISIDSRKVTWSEFTSELHGEESRLWGETPIDYSSLGPFVFDLEQYLDALGHLE